MLILGCHLSSSKGFLHMGQEALSIDANTFQFFTRNPRSGQAASIEHDDILALQELAKTHHFGQLLAHAPYTLNLCSAKPDVRQASAEILADDLARMELIPGNLYNLHPGSHGGQGEEKGIELTAQLLNKTLLPEMQTTVLIETMAGKGTEIGTTFEQIRTLLDQVDLRTKMGVCLDTCHIFAAGYDISHHLDDVLEQFDTVVGLHYLKALHLNDSMHPHNSRKDRHAKIGAGHIGLAAFNAIVSHPALIGLPMLLETPNELDGHAAEIALLRSFEQVKN